ncbi:unnamed protein product [Effrenium voratum]|nr:unnamed protein product [Effrenium voratum]
MEAMQGMQGAEAWASAYPQEYGGAAWAGEAAGQGYGPAMAERQRSGPYSEGNTWQAGAAFAPSIKDIGADYQNLGYQAHSKKDELVARVKTVQRADEAGRAKWEEYCNILRRGAHVS